MHVCIYVGGTGPAVADMKNDFPMFSNGLVDWRTGSPVGSVGLALPLYLASGFCCFCCRVCCCFALLLLSMQCFLLFAQCRVLSLFAFADFPVLLPLPRLCFGNVLLRGRLQEIPNLGVLLLEVSG